MPQTDDTLGGFPKLPFNPTPPPDLIERAMGGADDDPAAALRRVVAIFIQHMGLQQRNNDFAARFYGTADVAEEASEHWNYLRNANFLSTTYKWANNASVTRVAVTAAASLPYGIPRGINLTNNVGTKNWLQQSVSATGATWYVAGGWVDVKAGTGKAGYEVVENSGSASAKTHAAYYPVASGDWRRLGDPRRPAGLTFKTYKGTTRLTFRAILGSSMAASYAEVQLEKGRRAHPWRLSILDRGNYVTSLKTAGSASFYGNVVVSRAGIVQVRQVATKKFVFSSIAYLGTGTPNPVSATGAVGTSTLLSRQDHVHPGVRSLRTAGSASADGRLVISAGGLIRVRQTTQKIIVSSGAYLGTGTPNPVSATGAVGSSTLLARQDHVHPGVRSLRTAGSASFDGRLQLSGSGAVRFRQTTGKFIASTTGLLALSSTTPAKVSTAGTVGVGATAARADHVHRGVTAIKYGTTSNDGTVQFSGSGTGVALAWSGAKLKIGFPKPATATPTATSTSGTVGTGTLWARTDHRHRGVKALRVRGAQGSAAGTVRLSQSSNVTVRRSGQTVIVGATTGTMDITGLTAADPALGDESPIYDISAAANRKVTIQEIAGFGAIGVSELRLTLTSGTAVTTSDVTAAGTIYLAPYSGNRIRIYDGTRWNEYQTAELSLALTATSGSNYDVFVYDNAGTLTLELSAAWTNDTTRADALTTQDGVYVKSGATTRLYLGTIRASGTNTTEDSAAKRFVWNMYNRVPRKLKRVDTTDSWTYATNTWRSWNNSTANRVEFVCGLAEAHVRLLFNVRGFNNTAATNQGGIGIDLDGTTTGTDADTFAAMGSGVEAIPGTALYDGYPGLGYHFLQLMEIGGGTGTSTWVGDGGVTWIQSGAVGAILG